MFFVHVRKVQLRWVYIHLDIEDLGKSTQLQRQTTSSDGSVGAFHNTQLQTIDNTSALFALQMTRLTKLSRINAH